MVPVSENSSSFNAVPAPAGVSHSTTSSSSTEHSADSLSTAHEQLYPLTSVSPVDVVVAIFDYISKRENELIIQQGDTIYVLCKNESGWWDGLLVEANGKVRRGWFPQNYCRPLHVAFQNQSPLRSKRRASQIKASLSSQNSRRGSLHNQQISAHQGKLSFSSTSPTRHSFPTHLHTQEQAAQSQHHRSLSHSQSPTAPSFVSVSSGGAESRATPRTSIVSANSRDLSQSGKSILEGQSATSSNPSSGVTSRLGSRSMTSARVGKNKSGHQNRSHQQHPNDMDGQRLNILTMEEVEMIFNSIHTEDPPVWSVVPISDMDKVLYYNKHFDIYCQQLPLMSTPLLNESSNLATDDQLVDLTPRDSESSSKHNDKAFKLISYSNKTTSTPSKASSLSSASNTYQSPTINVERRGSASSVTNSPCFKVASETSAQQQAPLLRNVPQKHTSAPNVCTTSQGSSKKNQRPSFPLHHHCHEKPQAVLARPDLFYQHIMDIKLWPELNESTLYYAKRSHEMFTKNNLHDFEKLFQMASTYCTYTQIACRLSYPQIKETRRLNKIKGLLKRMIKALSKISINSNIYFSFSQRFLSNLNNTPRASEVSTTSVEKDGEETDVPPVSSITDSETLVDNPKNGQFYLSSGTSRNDPNFSFRSSFQRSNSATTTRTSIPSIKDGNEAELASTVLIKNLYDDLDADFTRLIRTLQLLYDVLQSSLTSSSFIPQLFPRFFRDSFNGGSWNNPFSQFDGGKSDFAGHSGGMSTNGSSVCGLPPKVAEAIAKASGCNAVNYVDFSSEIVSASQDQPSCDKNNPCTFFNRPSHHRTFSRSRASRNIQYPLNDNTVTMMKKRYFSICEKIDNCVLADEAIRMSAFPSVRKRQLEVASQTYEEVSSCILLEVLENLDLTIFVNLRTLIATKKNLDAESEEFLRHALSSISTLLTEFFDMKQAFHDTVIRLIMSAQEVTLKDPYVFCSMRSNTPVGFFEPGMSPSQSQFNKTDKMIADIYRHLIKQDVEFNDMEYLITAQEFSQACAKYTEIACLSCTVVEQLAEEKENLLNYAARMMKNDLTTELLRGEREKWYQDYEVFDSDDNESQTMGSETRGDRYQSDDNRASESVEKDTPWYLTSKYEKSLIYDQRGRVKGGTKEALIEHLTSHEVIDAWFNVTMLLTFRSMFTTREFLYALVYRYNLSPPEGLSYEEYNLWIEKKLNPIKCRVVSIMKSFFSQYWTSAYFEAGISATLNFAHIAVNEKIAGAQELYDEIKENLATKGKTSSSYMDFGSFSNGRESTDSGRSRPSASISKSSSSSFLKLRKHKLLDIDPRTYAAQLTIMEHAYYLQIPVFECLDRAWSSKYCDMGGSPNITKFIASANSLTNYVSHAIVQQTEVKMRVLLIQYFITVAQGCRELNNFSSMTAIVSALCSSPIFRLKKTWPLVSKTSKDLLKEMNVLMDSGKNFIRYRELLRSVKDVACVPFFGVYLSDLTFTFGGNPDFLQNSTDIINFSKRARIVDIVEEIMSFKRIHYKLKRFDDIQTIIESSLENVPHIEKQYELSLLIEPRTDAVDHSTANDPLRGYKSSAGPEDRSGRLFKSGKKQSSRLFSKPND